MFHYVKQIAGAAGLREQVKVIVDVWMRQPETAVTVHSKSTHHPNGKPANAIEPLPTEKPTARVECVEEHATESDRSSVLRSEEDLGSEAVKAIILDEGRVFTNVSAHTYHITDGSCCGYGTQKLVAYCAG